VTAVKKQKEKPDFATTSDGRLIIADSDDDDDSEVARNLVQRDPRGKKRKLEESKTSILAGVFEHAGRLFLGFGYKFCEKSATFFFTIVA
jgi:hypothetical protein